MAKRKLTQEEFDQLPDGADVVITWSGGNGPHQYKIHVDKWGIRRVYSQVPAGIKQTYSQPTYVGDHPLDQVWVEE